MKKITFLLYFITVILFSKHSYSQTLLATEGFETGTGLGEGTSYKSNTFQSGDPNASANDFWARTNVSPMPDSSNNQTYTGWTGTYHWNGEDIDDNGNPLGFGQNGYVVLQTLNISSYVGGTGTVSLQLAADKNGNGGWETSDGIFIEYAFDTDIATGANSVGGLPSSVANVSTGTYSIAGAFYGSDLTSPNNYLFEDTDLNGSGDGSELTNTFTNYSFDFNIPDGASNMSIRIRVATNQGGEILAFDEIKVYAESTTLGVDEQSFGKQILLYPNPTTEYIQISGLKSLVNYSIYNTIGSEISKGTISNDEKVNIQNLANGLYFLKLENGSTIRFIKK